jgi:very-short-patch-repair endonuclease
VDFALYRTIAQQGGVFTTAQARDSHSEWEIRRLIEVGRWRRTPWRGLLVDGEWPDEPALLVRAAALLVGPDLVACHSTAALLWGFDVLGASDLHFLGPPTLINRRRPGLQIHPSSLGTDGAVLVDGVWCTPPARTACDVVRMTAPIDGLPTLDAALAAKRCTKEQLVDAAAAQAGLRSVVRLRELVPYADPRVDSPMESRMRWRFIDGGLPAPDLQVCIPTPMGARFLDTGWRNERVGAEFDGLEAHMTRQQLRDDRQRHNALTEQRWTLLHFTDVDIYRRPSGMVRTVATALGRRP